MSSFGKHTANPGFKSGDHWLVCDRCGFDVYSSEARKTWDGLVVCPEDWEPRHEQDFVRAVADNQKARGLVRSPPADVFVSVTYTLPDDYETEGSYAIANIARAGRARAGKGALYPFDRIPSATHTGGL